MSWLHWAEYWYNTSYQISIGVTPFQAVYGRIPPSLLSYGDSTIPNSTLDQKLRDLALRVLKEHLRAAQERMKMFVDRKCREVKFQVKDWVLLKIHPYQ